MGKKKNAKLVSKTKQKKTSLAEKTEQILLTMPKIIATQIGKDLVVQKQQESKLKLELKKWELQKKKLTEKMTVLKQKGTAAAKKQANATQKALQKTQQMISSLVRNLELVKKQLQLLSQKKAKYMALQAHLMSFQKDWAKKMSVQPQKKTTVKAKTKKTAQKLTSKQQNFQPMNSFPQETEVLEIVEIPARQEEVEFAQEEPMESVS